ncbi:MMPL family transporter [Mycolicibacterium sp. P9-64]|uniref:MMPL family transporter n=1 Tax=Mycolicibacterium sp. P9-64 TaxID=2024612 RepID=UPI0011EFE577|nr:MMPL family transporter [Mycolicibacterium sp. P9-64]KAA0080720.1 MMPL family transporter [Mycolicibacterium sp. P9-64]
MALTRLGWLCANHPWRVLATWVIVIAAIVGLAAGVGGRPDDDYNAPSTHTEDSAATSHWAAAGGTEARVVVRKSSGQLAPAELTVLRDRLRAIPGVSAVSKERLSEAGDVALLNVRYDVAIGDIPGSSGVDALRQAIAPVQDSGLQVELGGDVPENYTPDGGPLERAAMIAAVCLFVVVFGSMVAVGIASVVQVVGVGTGLALMFILAGLGVATSTAAPMIATILGFAVGVDYVLLYLSRYREHRRLGHDVRTAAAETNGSAGRSIVIGGATVIVSLLGLRIVGIPQFSNFGYATAVVVGAVVLTAVTVPPAVCGLIGHRLPQADFTKSEALHSRWTKRWAEQLVKRPLCWSVAAFVALLLLAAPVVDMRTWPRDAGSRPTSDTVRRAHDLIASNFGDGANGPFKLIVDTRSANLQTVTTTLHKLRETAGVATVSAPVYNADRTATAYVIEPTTEPASEATADTLRRIRDGLPRGMYVTGLAPYFADVSDRFVVQVWVLMLVVIGIAAACLAIAFRAPRLAIAAGFAKFLGIAATYGVLVVLFQWGWAAELLGLPGPAHLSSWAAVLVFVIVFAVCTGYEVAMLSRIDDGRGALSASPVMISAATVVGAAFVAFALDPDVIVKMTCVGVSVGIVIDVVAVRMVLMPTMMGSLGRRDAAGRTFPRKRASQRSDLNQDARL